MNNTPEAKRRWVTLAVLYLGSLAFAIVMQSVPPTLNLIINEFSFTHAEGGLLMGFFALPGIIVAIPAGILADRYNQKIIGAVSLALMVIGAALFASGSSLFVFGLGRVISGIGSVVLLVVSPQILAQWFARRELGTAMGIFNTGMPLGTILSLNFLSLLAENAGWRASIWLSAGLSLLALIVFAVLFRRAPSIDARVAPPLENVYQGIARGGMPIWLIGIAWLLFNAAMISLFTFTPDLLTSSGFSVGAAGFLTGLVMWPALLLSPLAGYIMDRFGRHRTIAITGAVALAVLIFWVPSATGWILGLMVLIGIFQALIPAPVFALAPLVARPERLGLAYGIINVCLSLGIVAGPAAAGWLKDLTGAYQSSYILMSAFALLIIPTIAFLRLRP